jgi:hypothetical protein
MWRRSRSALAAALPAGAVIGAGIGLVYCLAMLGRFPDGGGWGALAYCVGLGALVGFITAITAAAGGVIAVLGLRSSARREEQFRRTAVIGSACGAAAPWIGFGVVDRVFSEDGPGFALFLAVGVVAAIIAAVASEALITRAERREREGALAP